MTKFFTVIALLAVATSLPAEENDALNSAIAEAIAEQTMPFRLQVNCANAESRRSLVLYDGVVGAWNGERQVRLPASQREEMLRMLLDADFAAFDERYGEQKRADKQEAPLRVSCRISLTINYIEKTSVQLLNGEQSSKLLGLAAGLLDLVEPLAANGETTSSLTEALVKIEDGVIEGQLLALRLLRLPATGERGYIVRIDGGQLTRQPYSPGDLVGELESQPLEECDMQALVKALNEARVWDLPLNLRHNEPVEFEIGVLDVRHTVLARSSFRNVDPDAKARLVGLVEQIEQLPLGCTPSATTGAVRRP